MAPLFALEFDVKSMTMRTWETAVSSKAELLWVGWDFLAFSGHPSARCVLKTLEHCEGQGRQAGGLPTVSCQGLGLTRDSQYVRWRGPTGEVMTGAIPLGKWGADACSACVPLQRWTHGFSLGPQGSLQITVLKCTSDENFRWEEKDHAWVNYI